MEGGPDAQPMAKASAGAKSSVAVVASAAAEGMGPRPYVPAGLLSAASGHLAGTRAGAAAPAADAEAPPSPPRSYSAPAFNAPDVEAQAGKRAAPLLEDETREFERYRRVSEVNWCECRPLHDFGVRRCVAPQQRRWCKMSSRITLHQRAPARPCSAASACRPS
jgi:hypothetical protein